MEKHSVAKKEYVLHFMLKPTMPAQETDNFRARMNEKIQAHDAQILASLCEERARRLAYPIEKESQAYFCESVFRISPKKVRALFDSLMLEPQIIRYTIERKQKIKKRKQRKAITSIMREEPGVPASAPIFEPSSSLPSEIQRETSSTAPVTTKREKISMEEIDKKLDEIIKNI